MAVLIVTAALAVLLAVQYHLAWPPVVVAILGTLPALYLAWAAVPGTVSPPEPGTVKKPAYGRPVTRWDPAELGVHRVIGSGPMPTYVRRPHDELLRAVLDPAVAASRLVVVRGGSSTGKSRAAYEAVADRVADWRLDYPLDPGALAQRLDAGIATRTVLWLGELRQYADADGGPAVLARLADLLAGDGHLIITAVWPEHWDTLTAAARAGPGPADQAGVAGRLLARLPELTGGDPGAVDPGRGGVIDVPARFTTAEMTRAARSSDRVLAAAAEAAASAGQDGQVTQYLAGVPDLLRRYDGPGGDPYGQAVISAAMDAVRLGHTSPLPAVLVQEAAVGYLTGPQRTATITSWRDTALDWATEELNGAVRALAPVPPMGGTGVAGYWIADYLDQHGRRTRQDQLGPASLWDALIAHTASAGDLTHLAGAARDRGLYRHATALWTKAVTAGSTDAPSELIAHMRLVDPDDAMPVARWAATHASLDDPHAVARLLLTLGQAGAREAVAALLTRDPASHATLDNPQGVAELLGALREAGAGDAVTALATRAADPTSLDNLSAVAWRLKELRAAGPGDTRNRFFVWWSRLYFAGAFANLLRELREAGVGDAVTALATRAADHASLDDPQAVAELLGELRKAEAGEAVSALAHRAAAHADLSAPKAVADLLAGLRAAGAGDAVTALLARDPASHASLDHPWGVADLLGALREAGADGAVTGLATRAADHAGLDDPWGVAGLLGALRAAGAGDAVTALLARDPAGHVSVDDSRAVAGLLGALREAGAGDAVTGLATRAADHAGLDDPWPVADLLGALRAAGADDAVTALLARDPAGHASLGNPEPAAALLQALRAAGADDAVTALLARDPAGHVSVDNPRAVPWLLRELGEAGADDAVTTLATRAAGHTLLDDPDAVTELLQAFRDAGTGEAVTELAARAADAGMFAIFAHARPDEASQLFGREPDGAPSRPWKWHDLTGQAHGMRAKQPDA